MVTEMFERYRGADDPAVKAHVQLIWLKAQRWRTGEVARTTGYKPDCGGCSAAALACVETTATKRGNPIARSTTVETEHTP